MTSELEIFSAITSFVQDLTEGQGKKSHSLILYNRLIEQTKIAHKKAITKHVAAFTEFYNANTEAILSKNIEKLQGKISYSEKVFIDVKVLLQNADVDSKTAIWGHLLHLSSLVDPVSKAKDMLKALVESRSTSSSTSSSIANMIDKISKNVNINSSNPMDTISSMMQSGVFTDLISSMNSDISSGKLDIGSLMTTVQTLAGSMMGGSFPEPTREEPKLIIVEKKSES